MKILVTGGCGYIGTELISRLLKENYKVISVDLQYYGNKLKKHKNLINLKLNFNDLKKKDLDKVDTVIHLASISNDPAALLDSKITWETNVLYTQNLLEVCREAQIKKFLFASSGSVYGISKKDKVDENTKLIPLSDYNKTKMIGEKLISRYQKYFKTVMLRPGTVCGFSSSLRLDLTVNAMTHSAITKGKIFVNGGNQIRPHLHIDDMINAYIFFLKSNKTGIFNVGFENLKVIEIAKIIKSFYKKCTIKINKNIDKRSYKLYSKKIIDIGFMPTKKTYNAIKEIIERNKVKKIKADIDSIRTLKLKKLI